MKEAKKILRRELIGKYYILICLNHINIITFRYGTNKKRMPKIRTLLELILENFEDRIL